jgi:MerR family transcriptional regulator, light-induced transcriptional regulator
MTNAQEAPIPEGDAVGQFRIAAVARQTGIAETTIRMWERRYGVVTPARSAGNGRLYSRADVERLRWLKQAVDAGHAIGTVASLPNSQLRERLQSAPLTVRKAGTAALQVLVAGAALLASLRAAWQDRTDLQLIDTGRATDAEAPESLPAVDVLLFDDPSLSPATVAAVRRLRQDSRAQLAIVVFGFGNRQTLQRLDAEGVIALASPVDPSHLARLCHLALGLDRPKDQGLGRQWIQPPPPRRYDDQFLADSARRVSGMYCECPNHLAELLVKVNAFEAYSLQCEQQAPDDASVHGLLVATAARCRALLEEALTAVMQHEGLDDVEYPKAQTIE